METGKLKKFAQIARQSLLQEVSAKLNLVLSDTSRARREAPESVKRLEEAINKLGQEQLIERVAYIWFNRFCALRFMDVNHYTKTLVVSFVDGDSQPEILAEAKLGHIDEELFTQGAQTRQKRQEVFDLLSGRAPSFDAQGEAYRLLLVAACNYWHRVMPFLFQRIDDYTELLMPENLLSEKSILTATRDAINEDVCQDVEVIGWLYQYYISEKKEQVFLGLKKNKKITAENIPAATQLFTPHWIVRYLVENSLGRLWMLNHPKSKLIDRMEYYIRPEQNETDFLRISKPEEIKVCDPACGSGHILTYAFDVLYAIYEEEGYEPAEISEKILRYNLYGIEIDERAAELASFALCMKARAKQRRFFQKSQQPNICLIKSVQIEDAELENYMDFIGHDLFTNLLKTTLSQFKEASHFGSLIRPALTDVQGLLELLKAKNIEEHLFLSSTHKIVLEVLQYADYLSPKYHVVIANPPYMGAKGMNARLAEWVKTEYGDVKSDLFAMFMVRGLELTLKNAYAAMVTMQSWMFLSSLEALRKRLLERQTVITMAHLGPKAFNSIGGEVVSTTAFVAQSTCNAEYKGSHLRLVEYGNEAEKDRAMQEAIRNPNCGWFYRASAEDFKKIPGSPIAYWVSDRVREVFLNEKTFEASFSIKAGISTGRNEQFILLWTEVESSRIRKGSQSVFVYCPHNKGGEFRKWMGNLDTVLKYSEEHISQMEKNPGFRHDGQEYYFRMHIGWSKITSSKSSFRLYPEGFTFDSAGLSLFSLDENSLYEAMGFLNSKVSELLILLLNPTLNVTPQVVKKLPLISLSSAHQDRYVRLYHLSRLDWDSYETSWNFKTLPLLQSDFRASTLEGTYKNVREHWRKMTFEMQKLEEENNRIFIDAYGLKEELSPDVSLSEVTLTCNPHYRYGAHKTEDDLEAALLADSIRELISYAVGCMFGRYAIDKPGLILANQGETLEDYLKQIPKPSFSADDDNVIPILDANWFTDDIVERFRKFLRLAFGEAHYEDNISFIERAFGKKGKPQSIREYFLKDFYNDHLKRYKKRPIYWLFSSPKGSFNALIYMHRYKTDTVSLVLNEYLREFRSKLTSKKSHLEELLKGVNASASEKNKATKETESLRKIISELDDYEREILYPLATKQISIALDDGVKVNYAKFGAALKKIPGLEEEE